MSCLRAECKHLTEFLAAYVMQDCEKIAKSDDWFLSPALSEPDIEHTLRAAAMSLGVTVYLFDIESMPACCKVYPPCKPPAKVSNSKGKVVHRIEQPAWLLTLGQDLLPQQICSSGLQASQAPIVIARANGSYHPYSAPQPFNSQNSATAASIFRDLGLEFCEVTIGLLKRPSRCTGEPITFAMQCCFVNCTAISWAGFVAGSKRKREPSYVELDSDPDISDCNDAQDGSMQAVNTQQVINPLGSYETMMCLQVSCLVSSHSQKLRCRCCGRPLKACATVTLEYPCADCYP